MLGNPLIKEEMELQAAIKDLKTEKSRYMEKIYELQDNIRVKMPSMIQTSEVRIKYITADLETARSQPKVMTEDGKETYPVKIGDRTYSDRKEGGTALKLAIADNIGAIAEGKTIEVGEYRGLKLSIFYDTLTKHTKACLEGEKHHYCELNPETDSGNLIRLDNCINNIEKDINQTQEIVDRSKAELEQMKIDVEKPFGKADELSKAEARLEEVHEALTKLELTNDSMHKEIFERFCDIFPDIMHGYTDSERYKAGDQFDTLSVELHGDILSVEHTYEQNGDLMYDPRIDFKVDYDNEKVIPVSYENSGMGIYNTYDSGAEPTPESVRKINEVLEFTDTWLDNIEEQGYEIRPQERSYERAAVGR